jgi:3-oxoacyl-[acyl-carrier-protein] synthase-3
MRVKITGTGSYIPTIIKKNEDFLNVEFYNEKKERFPNSNEIIIKKFKAITGIEKRRYLIPELDSSNMGIYASEKAIKDAKIDKESLDYIIVAENFGDVKTDSNQSDFLPSIGSRIKHGLKIKNPNCVAYDVIFGCPGWIQSMIQAYIYIKSGEAKKCLVVGTETLSRIVDPNDRDSMIYADGAGSCIVEASNDDGGILSYASQTFTLDEAYYLFFGNSNNPNLDQNIKYIKMYGRKIYEFALKNVPLAMKEALDKSRVSISQIKKILIHQANEKMDEAIVERFYKLYNMKMPENIMPMTISKFGNSSVATIPTLLDLILHNKLDGHQFEKGDTIILASVGAGMNINAIVYQF